MAAITSTKVAEAYLKTISGVPADKVGPTLPASLDTWAASGFWQVSVVGGSPHVDLGTKRPVIEVSCWAATPEAEFPPYNRAENYATVVRNAAEGFTSTHLTIEGTGVFLLGVRAISEPLRVPDVRTGYARVMVQLQLDWEVV